MCMLRKKTERVKEKKKTESMMKEKKNVKSNHKQSLVNNWINGKQGINRQNYKKKETVITAAGAV